LKVLVSFAVGDAVGFLDGDTRTGKVEGRTVGFFLEYSVGFKLGRTELLKVLVSATVGDAVLFMNGDTRDGKLEGGTVGNFFEYSDGFKLGCTEFFRIKSTVGFAVRTPAVGFTIEEEKVGRNVGPDSLSDGFMVGWTVFVLDGTTDDNIAGVLVGGDDLSLLDGFVDGRFDFFLQVGREVGL
jgi:hypothetical protein